MASAIVAGLPSLAALRMALTGRQKLFLPQSLAPKMGDFSEGPGYNRPGGGVGVSGKLAMGHS